MAKILILGGGGMVGQKLAHRLVQHGLNGTKDHQITLFDLGFPASSPASATQITGTLTDNETLSALAAARPDVIYHLASIVSGEAEQDFDKGWLTNMMPMWQFLMALRAEHDMTDGAYCPKLVFTSSIAVFGGPYPEKISDDFLQSPQTSYGAQKATCEMMIQDFSRKGFIDGMSLRLPTVCVRPGKPNLAASSFFSGIIREPLNGQTAILPVPDTARHWHVSPRTAAKFLTHAAELDTAKLNNRRALNLPGVSCTVAEQIEALRDIAGQAVVDLIQPKTDPAIAKMVAGWPQNFAPDRATTLGFKAEDNFHQIIQTYIDDDL